MGYDTTAWTTAGNTLTIGGTTMYAEFGITSSSSSGSGSWDDDTHYLIPYNGVVNTTSIEAQVSLGGSTDPATSFTTADGGGTDGSALVSKLWYLPDNIYIDGIYSLEGASNATSITTTWHLMSFDFTSGSTSCLTNGEELASNTTTNAGSEQIYLNSWTVDTPVVAAGKVVVATFYKNLSTGFDCSANVKVKYHLT